MDLLALISSYFPSLSKSEKKVAQYVLANSDEVVNLSINELSRLADVGESTIVRFTRKVGFSGFQDFKLELARRDTISKNLSNTRENQSKNEIYTHLLESLEETLNFMEKDQLEAAANYLFKARKVFIFAVGTSGITAQYLNSRLSRLGIAVEYNLDGHLQSISATLTSSDDAIIAISTSGNTKEVIQNIELAQSNATPVVTITNFLGSRISKIGDVSLVVSSKEFVSDSGSFDSAINQLFLIDTLIKTLVKCDAQHFRQIRGKTNQALLKRIE